MDMVVEYIKPIEGISSSPFPKHWAFSSKNASLKQKMDVLDLSRHAISPDQAIHIVYERVLSEINNLFESNKTGISILVDRVIDRNPIVVGHLIAERAMHVVGRMVTNQKQIIRFLPGAIHKGIGNATTILEELDALTPVMQQAIDTIQHTALMRLNELTTTDVLPVAA